MIIAVTNQKGGVGKTTTTLNLAVYLADLGKKVLLVDLDPQANLTSGAGVRNAFEDYAEGEQLKAERLSIYNVLVDNEKIEAVMKTVPNTKVDIIPSAIDLAGAEIELVNIISRETTLKAKLKEIKANYDYILIDCPPSLGLLTINALVAADAVIIPVQSEFYALEGLGQLLNTVNLVKKKLNARLEILGIVITMFDGRTNLSKQVASEISRAFPGKVFNTIVPRNVSLSEAPSHGQPINIYQPDSTGAKSYRALAKEVIAKES
jgi:chromosome partitioning protein